MKFVSSHEQLPNNTSEEISYNIRGEIAQSEEKIFSQFVNNKYLIRTFNNVPLDPFGPEAGRQIWNRTELKSVSKTTFENYNNYLLTRNRLFFTKANRSYING
jgi:hypothetical protein